MQRKYIGYVRISFLALILILAIFGFDSLIRSAAKKSPGGKNGSLIVTVDTSGDEYEPVPVTVTEVTEPAADDSSYKKSDFDESRFRKLFKTKADLGLGELVLINKDNPYRFPDISAVLVKMAANMPNRTFKLSYNTHQVQKSIMDPLNNMMGDFNSAYGVNDVTVITSTLSYAEQNDIYKAPADPAVPLPENQLAPGYSEHHSGYSLDFKLVSSAGQISEYDGTGDFKWINDNCYKYGFIIRYPEGKEDVTGLQYSPSHFRYVGVPHSYIMNENGFTLEEYMNDLKKYIFGYEHLEYSVFGYDYEIYFIPAEENGDTTVPVPVSEAYTVSGNNCDGFIVTICRASDAVKNEQQNDAPVTAAAEVTQAAAVTAQQ